MLFGDRWIVNASAKGGFYCTLDPFGGLNWGCEHSKGGGRIASRSRSKKPPSDSTKKPPRGISRSPFLGDPFCLLGPLELFRRFRVPASIWTPGTTTPQLSAPGEQHRPSPGVLGLPGLPPAPDRLHHPRAALRRRTFHLQTVIGVA